jgi:hypothetical protein
VGAEYVDMESREGEHVVSIVNIQQCAAAKEPTKKTDMYLINCIDVHMSVTHLLMVVIVQFPNSCSLPMPNSMHTFNGISVP